MRINKSISALKNCLLYAVYADIQICGKTHLCSLYKIRIHNTYWENICAYISAYPHETGRKSCGFRKYKGIYICGYPKRISAYGQFYSIPAHMNKFCETQLIIL